MIKNNQYITIEAGTASKVFGDAASVIEYATEIASGKHFTQIIGDSYSTYGVDGGGNTTETKSCIYEYDSQLVYKPFQSILTYPTFIQPSNNLFSFNNQESLYECCVDVPGFDKDNLTVSYNRINRTLQISGQSKQKYINISVSIPFDGDCELINATVLKGQLILKMPKLSAEQVKIDQAIPIKIS